MLRALEFWLYGKDPLAPLAFEAPLQAIKDRLEAGEPYFEHLIEATWSTTATAPPSSSPQTRAGRARRRRAQRLDEARAAMSDEEAGIHHRAYMKTLKERQETPTRPKC
jgi:presequence protease